MRCGEVFRLKKLLEDAGADEEMARDVVFKAADGYDDSIPFTRAMQDDVMLAYLMNGEKLPKSMAFHFACWCRDSTALRM